MTRHVGVGPLRRARMAIVVAASSALALAACSQRVELPTGDGVLAWSCGALVPGRAPGNDPERVRSRALALIRLANQWGDHAVVRTLVGALAHDDPATVDADLGRLLCDRPDYRGALARLDDSRTERADRGSGADRRAPHGSAAGGSAPPELTLPLLHPGPAAPSDGGGPIAVAGSPDGRGPARAGLDGGAQAPDTFRLSDLRGRRVYLSVFGSWCPACREEYPGLARLAERFRRAGDHAPVLVGLLLRDSPERALDFMAERGGPAYPVAILDRATEAAWGITGAPMGFLIGPDGRVEGRCFGCQRGPLGLEALERLVADPAT